MTLVTVIIIEKIYIRKYIVIEVFRSLSKCSLVAGTSQWHSIGKEWGMKIGKTYSFEAAHHLPNHNGKCKNPHGHSYRLEVEVEGGLNPFPGASDQDCSRDLPRDGVRPQPWHRTSGPEAG